MNALMQSDRLVWFAIGVQLFMVNDMIGKVQVGREWYQHQNSIDSYFVLDFDEILFNPATTFVFIIIGIIISILFVIKTF